MNESFNKYVFVLLILRYNMYCTRVLVVTGLNKQHLFGSTALEALFKILKYNAPILIPGYNRTKFVHYQHANTLVWFADIGCIGLTKGREIGTNNTVPITNSCCRLTKTLRDLYFAPSIHIFLVELRT